MSQPRAHTRLRAFTLLEILVVVAIIAVLVAITTMVGSAVIDTGKKRATLGVLQSLDAALAAYIDQHGEKPPALVEIPYASLPAQLRAQFSPGESGFYPAIDGRGRDGGSGELFEVNSVALFIESAKSVPATQEIINSISPKYIQNFSPDEQYFPFLLTAFDAWGNPIRYVHPKFDGIMTDGRRSLGDAGDPLDFTGIDDDEYENVYFTIGSLPANTNLIRFKQVRRNLLLPDDFDLDPTLLPDSDGGLTSGDRPYFYSAGPDGNPATIEDNIYITPVQHQDPGVN